LFLAFTLALVSALIVSQLMLESLEGRFENQLIEAGKLTSDHMVFEERSRLETLRLLANTDGIVRAIQIADADRLRRLVLPVAVNASEEAIDIVSMAGISLLSIRRVSLSDYQFTSGEDLTEISLIQKVRQGTLDSYGDKYAGLVERASGLYFAIAGPVFDVEGIQVGVILVGRSLESLASELRQQTMAQISLYSAGGRPLASTLVEFGSQQIIGPTMRVRSDYVYSGGSPTRQMVFGSIPYREIIDVWRSRGTTSLGYIGTAIPETFLVNPSDHIKAAIIIVLTAGLFLVVSIGLYLSRRITEPLLQVVKASSRAANGDLSATVSPRGSDEITVLGHAFNQMMIGLRESTEQRIREVELVNALEQERELRQMKSRFVSVVSHEFRTPLATILSSSEYIQAYGHIIPAEKREKHFQRIQSAVKNMTGLLEEVLIIGRSESGRLEFSPSEVDMLQFCRELAEEIESNTKGTHRIRLRTRGERTRYWVDTKLMRLAVSNLLFNAVKYSPQGGQVTLVFIGDPDQFTIIVEDTGIGIPESDQARLFETFYRASNTKGIPGTGLGLYITRMAVDLHDGTVHVQSQVGVGSTFTLTIPLKEPMPE
jgi:signal transduction histidine kinase